MARITSSSFLATAAAIISTSLSVASVSDQDVENLRPAYYKKWRENPKMVVFGDSSSDVGRRFNAPDSFDFEDIGPYPWTKLFEARDSDSMFRAYLPAAGSPTNGQVWPSWLRIPDEYNFATSSASASQAFRSLETCTGYIGEADEFPTATLSEQITRYFNEVVDETDETLDYTHVIFIGANEPNRMLEAFARYAAGGAGYVDPVAFDDVFEIVDGVPSITFVPVITEIVTAWQEGIVRLIQAGVTGRILLTNLPTPIGLTTAIEAGLAETLDAVSLQVSLAAQTLVQAFPQVRLLDLYSLSAAIVVQPEIFTDLGFTADARSALGDSCLTVDFIVDTQADIMGTQADRAAGCQEECALCADTTFPCQTCFEGNPSATVCDDPETHIFWDDRHFTTAVNQILGDAIRQCAKDSPNYDQPWVGVLCPEDA
eukprot:jgi/Undpi1/12163/HiC_scaffold_5.g01839.m1